MLIDETICKEAIVIAKIILKNNLKKDNININNFL
jgi:hypothetical protein